MDVQRLKEIREDRDLFQSDIAKVLNTTQSQYSLYETGLRLIPIDKLEKLAKYYDKQQQNFNTQLDFQRQQADFWRQQLDTLEEGSDE